MIIYNSVIELCAAQLHFRFRILNTFINTDYLLYNIW